MKNIYNDKTYFNNNPGWHEEDADYKANLIASLLNHHPLTFQTVCEIGCGSGEILVQLSHLLPQVESFTGYDVSVDALAIARQKETKAIHFELRDITTASPDRFFDLALVIDVLEHVPDYFSLLSATALLSRYTLFHIPLDMCVWSLFREGMLTESKKRVGHIHNFTEDFILSVLEDYGFQMIMKRYTAPINRSDKFKERVIFGLRKLLFFINQRWCTKLIGGYSLLVFTENKLMKL